jgi:O-antigen/teichoic acid export membrane protein
MSVGNDMTTYWFRPKQYGYGATPTTWQGWVITIAAVIVVVAATSWLTALSVVNPWFWAAVLVDAVVIAALWVVSRRKTDGEWRWRWGDR